MKRYPKYKDSGIEWIGEIPEHWIVTCLKRICLKITDGSHFSPESKDIGFPYITVQDIKDNGIDFKNCKYISGEDYLSLKKGGCQPDKFDILLTKDGTIGKAVVIKQNRDFVILSSLGLITPNLSRIISDYLRYYLISGINIDQMFSFIRGSALTRLTINLIKQLHVVYPPLPEQQTIANYLGRKTHQIDTLIENKQKLISLLKEQRAAIINHAVTKGLNPNVKQKDSGIEWLGEIPEHLEIVKLKRATQFLYGESLSNENRLDGKVPVYGSNGVTGYHNEAITKSPCIVIGRKGSFGKVNYSDKECFPIDTTFYIDTTATPNNLRWLYYLLLTLRLDSFSKDSAVPGLNREEAYERIISLPPLPKQQAIANYLDSNTHQIDTLIEKHEKSIDYLKEYRTTLISEVVTGKIDVRDSEIPQVIQS